MDESEDSDGNIAGWEWDFGDGTTSMEQHPEYVYASAGNYTVTLVVLDDTGLTSNVSHSIDVGETDADTGAFVEEDGVVVMEAEHFAQQFPNAVTQDTWVSQDSGFGDEMVVAMQALEDDGDLVLGNYTMGNAEMQYPIVFNTVGTYYVWLRLWAPLNGRSVYVGDEGQSTRIGVAVQEVPSTNWRWYGERNPDRPAEIQIDEPGETSFSIWMREDGLAIDRIILTMDPTYVPEGPGPAESPRESFSMSENFAAHGPELFKDTWRSLPVQFFEYPLYPNPATGDAIIELDLLAETVVHGGIYDVLGRQVKSIAQQVLSPGRKRRVTIQVSSLTPGVYLYRLQAFYLGELETIQGQLVVAK